MERREERGPRTDRNVNLSASRAPPLIVTFTRGEAAVQDRDALTESLFQSRGEHRRERDFGDEQQRLFAPPHPSRITSTYTSVFPLPVTPSRRNGANVPSDAVMLSM